MDIFDVLTLIGGLCLFLFGMNLMGGALERSAGSKLEIMIGKLTSGKLAGLLTGLGVTAVIQSSSATTVMIVGFVNSRLMNLKQAIHVIMGANIGTTVTAWILSLSGISGSNMFLKLLKPSSFTPVLALIGIVLFMFTKSNKKKDIGMVLLGFATLMFGMETMTGAVSGLRDVPAFQELFIMFKNPILGVIAGAILTAIIQSSSASVGILQALAATGAVSYGAAIPIIMGQNIGTCVTAMISSVGTTKNAKRAALVHLSFNIIGTVVCLVVFSLMAKKVTEPLMKLDLEHPSDNSTYEELTPILTKVHKQHKQIKSQMETLRRKSDEFEQIVSSMNEGLVLLDEHGMVLSMNTAAKKIFAVKKDVNGSDFLLVDRTSKMSKAIWNALDGNHSEYTEERNGSEYQFTVNPIESDGKVLGAVILVFDISDRAFAERNRQEFTANVTHELKTPLQSIIGSAELLENGLVKPEDTARFVGNIRKEATRLVSLINDIIRLSQLDENHEPATETVELTEVAKEVVEVLTVSAAKRNVELTIEGEPQTIFGVRRYIYEIIYNLCDNAIRYNVDGGKVEIKIGKDNGRAVVSVKDTGIGIAPEHQSRIFERFYRVDKSHSKETGGTGLGLSIVKHAVQYHSGKVNLESEVGKGTTITITF